MTEREQARNVAKRLAMIRHFEEVSGNVAKTCRYYGISRPTFYKWFRRYQEHGLEGLRDTSSRPHISPNATRSEVVGKIVYLREHYHFGPHKIAMYLKRYHDIQISPVGCVADPQAPGHEPAAGLAALQAAHRPVEAIREAPAGS